jgi:hypothetical protein
VTVTLRKFPYPFRAALAISSDIDATASTDEFLAIQRFLNTTGPTPMGDGVGLEIGNSFFFYDEKRTFSYFTHEERARQVIIDHIHTGYIDFLHTYGDAATERDQMLRGLDELNRHDCKLDVWINHYGSHSNLTQKFAYALGGRNDGDIPGTPAYHADATLQYGIKFVWVGVNTRLIGQSAARSGFPLRTVFDRQHARVSAANMVKELRKKWLGHRGDPRYTILAHNRLTQPLTLADGQQVHEFLRYCNHPVNISQGATSRGLAYAISKRALDQLKAVEGFSIVYTHFGQNDGCGQPICKDTCDALRHLAREHRDGSIYVTTTARLLRYHNASEHLKWSAKQDNGQTYIYIESLDDPVFGCSLPAAEQLQGLTFYVPDSQHAAIYLNGTPIESIQRNPADHTGRPSVTIPLTHLTYPYA